MRPADDATEADDGDTASVEGLCPRQILKAKMSGRHKQAVRLGSQEVFIRVQQLRNSDE
jgi:hypothetical protein